MSLPNKRKQEVQILTWSLIDETISQPEIKRLEELLVGDEDARRLYITCMQMHVDLQLLLDPRKTQQVKTPPASPVLGSLAVPKVGGTGIGATL